MDELDSRQPTAATEASVDDVNTEPQAPNQPEEGATEQEEEEEKEELDSPRKSTDGVNFYAQPKVRTVLGLPERTIPHLPLERIRRTVKPRNTVPKCNGNAPIKNAKPWTDISFNFLYWQKGTSANNK